MILVAKLLIQTVESLTGIRIDHYVEIGFGGFVNVVDSVGGITICPSHNMDDRLANLHVKKGCQHADGAVRPDGELLLLAPRPRQ